jgi:hypothetical protein
MTESRETTAVTSSKKKKKSKYLSNNQPVKCDEIDVRGFSDERRGGTHKECNADRALQFRPEQ